MPTFKERIQWLFRMAMLLFVLASVAFLSALTAMRFAIQGREVAMPDVVGHKAVEAQQTLYGRGVGIKIEDRIYNSLPVDAVVRQSPPPGTRVKIGQYAHVVLSLGPQKATIPNLEGGTLRTARIELIRRGMQVGEVSSAYVAGFTPDAVIQQDPSAGTSDVTSPHVNLLVSQGTRPAAFVMPDLGGLPLGEAEARLASGGLKATKFSLVNTLGVAHGTVIGQTPARGARVEQGGEIHLQIAE